MMLEAQRRRAGEAEHHRLAPRGLKPLLGGFAHQLRAIAVGEDQTGILGNDLTGEVHGDREIEPVAIIQIFMPLAVRPIVHKAGLDLDDQHVATRRQSHHVGTAPIGQRKLGEDRMAERAKRPAHATLNFGGDLRLASIKRNERIYAIGVGRKHEIAPLLGIEQS